MRNRIIKAADDQSRFPERRHRKDHQRNTELSLRRKIVSFTVEKSVFELLLSVAEKRNLRLDCMVQNIVLEWIMDNQ